jgi:hypothetical protein
MTYADLENKPYTAAGGQVMTFQPSTPKPPGYIAKDAIYGALKELEEGGLDINDITNEIIADIIREKYDFNENGKTISAYKSQYKKSRSFIKPAEGSEYTNQDQIYNIIKLSKKAEKVLTKMMEKWDIDKPTLRSILNATLDSLDDEDSV